MARIFELARFPAPGPEPLGFAFLGATLWVSSREGHRLYAIEPATWTIREEFATPGAPFGIAVAGDAFRVVIGFGEDDDDRYLYRFVPGNGFDDERIACPDLSGAFIAFHGKTLYLSQAHNKKILGLDDEGQVLRTIDLERRPVGMAVFGDTFYVVTVDDDWKNTELAEMEAGAMPRVTALASIPFGARGLAFDGTDFWTSHRAVNEIVKFVVGEGKRST